MHGYSELLVDYKYWSIIRELESKSERIDTSACGPSVTEAECARPRETRHALLLPLHYKIALRVMAIPIQFGHLNNVHDNILFP